MKTDQTHYVIIGNGVAGVEAALTIRERYAHNEARVTIVSKETEFFFSRTALMYAYMDMMDRKDLEPYERGSWAKQSIELVHDEVVDLDADAGEITLKAGGALAFDKLLLAVGSTPRKVPFKGLDAVKEGVVNFVSMQDLEACERLTWSTEQAVVVGGGLIGIELVESLLHHKVTTTFLVREETYWPVALMPAEGTMAATHMRHHGADLRLAEEIDEILVDDGGRVRGVLTSLGNEIPCQMLGLCIGVVAQVDWLKSVKTPPEIGRSICVDRGFKTSLEGVWAAGDCLQMDVGAERPLVETIWYSAKRHGRLAAQAMMGDEVRYEAPLFYNSSKFFEIEYTTVGDVTRTPEGAQAHYARHPSKELSINVTYMPGEGDRVIGFNMLGSRWNHRILERWILERRAKDWVLEHLGEPQFDVEFGRVKLSELVEADPQKA